MTRRVVLIVLGGVLLALGALTAIGGGALMALFGSSDTLNSGVQQVSTPTRALVSPVAAIQKSTGVQTVFGTVRLHITATPAGTGQHIFIGIGPAAAVDRYLSGVSHDVATDVTLTPFHLTLARHPGAAQPAPPGSQSFWVAEASGNHATLSWTVTDGSYRIVAMNTGGTAPVSLNTQLSITCSCSVSEPSPAPQPPVPLTARRIRPDPRYTHLRQPDRYRIRGRRRPARQHQHPPQTHDRAASEERICQPDGEALSS